MSEVRPLSIGAASDPEILDSLWHLSRDALTDRWQELYGTAPPRHLSRSLMVRAIAYRIQEQALGGLKPAVRKRLKLAGQNVVEGRMPASGSRVKPGTRLLREWHGTVHEVMVLEAGVQDRGRTWASLSAVAREITGARWSGPRFFGLKGRGDGHR